MLKKYACPALLILFTAFTGCIKETYNLDKLSDKIDYSPAFSISAIKGKITLGDLIKANDTVRYDNDNFVRIVFKKDSVVDLKLEDFYDLSDMITYSQRYTIGEIKIKDFQSSIPVTLNTISQSFSPALRATFVALDDGSPHNFPFFPVTVIPEKAFSVFQDFQNAVFASGSLEISVKNNLQAPLNDVKVRLYNTAGHVQIGTEMVIPAIAPGSTKSAIMNLTGKTVTNSIVAAITFNGSPGTTSPVIVDLDHSVVVGIYGYNLKVQSGRIKIPSQNINSIEDNDTITIDPGNNVEIEKLRVNTGNLSYTLISNSSISGSFTVSLPTSLRSDVPVTETISVTPGPGKTGNISVNNTELDLSMDPLRKYNRVPVKYTVTVTSNETIVNFNKNDSLHLDLKLLNPDFDYVKGYFGQLTEQIDPDTLKTDIDEILNHIKGQLHISDPSVRINYSNSFGIPFEVTLNAAGIKGSQKVNLGLSPFIVNSPTTSVNRIITSSFTVNKANSSLPDLISMPPTEIRFSGSGRMNPQGFTGTRNNYVFGDSRFFASMEIEVPMTLWMNNLQFADTLDNFLKPDDSEGSSFSPENTEMLILNISAENGFPLGASLNIMLYDSASKKIQKSIEAKDILKPAPVDANGKSSGKTKSMASIECDKAFFDASKKSDKMILVFTLNTTGEGTKDVRIYSDYSLSFSIGVKIKPNL